ncbi:hypothetical protein GCM10023175_63880 [Pseudonocardia xishanensis]|uniref:Uncharacterized protein n=1 Tax=Pseudonocardia xishanensis TaxID=630995 RepID=A0ABP8S1L6_9PSEU
MDRADDHRDADLPLPRQRTRSPRAQQRTRHPRPGLLRGPAGAHQRLARRPRHRGTRVGVIGTGSTGTQFIIAAAKAAEHLTVFQRSPQYWVPSGNGTVDPAEVARTKESFDAIWHQVRNSVVGFGFEESGAEAMSVSAEERQRVFQENRDEGNGFRFMFGTFRDIATNPDGERRRRVHPVRDRRDRRRPGDRRRAHPDRPLRQAPAVQRGLLRDLPPRERGAGLAQGEPHRGDHGDR